MSAVIPTILSIRGSDGNEYNIPALRGFSYALNEDVFELTGVGERTLNIKNGGITKSRLASVLRNSAGYYITFSGSYNITNMTPNAIYYAPDSAYLTYKIISGGTTHTYTYSIPPSSFLIMMHSGDTYIVHWFAKNSLCATRCTYVVNTSFNTTSLEKQMRDNIASISSTLTHTVETLEALDDRVENYVSDLTDSIDALNNRVGPVETDLSNFHTDYNHDMAEISSVLDTLDQGKVSIRQADANIGKTIGVNRSGNAVPEGRIVNMDLPTYVLNATATAFTSYPDFVDLQAYHDVYKQYLIARVVYTDGSVDYLSLTYASEDSFVFNNIYAAKGIEYIEHVRGEVPTYENTTAIIAEELYDTTSTTNTAKQQVMSRYGTSKAIKDVENLIKKPGVQYAKQISAVNIYGNQDFINDDKVKGIEFVSTIPAVDDATVTLNTLYIAPLVGSPYYHMLKASSSYYNSKPYMVCYTQGVYQCVSISAQPFYCDAGSPAGLKNDSVTCLTYKTVFTEYGINWDDVQTTAGALNFNNDIYIRYANHEVANTSSIYTVIAANLAYDDYGNGIASNYITRVWYNVPSGVSGIVNLGCDTKIIESDSFYKLIYPIIQTNAVLKSHTTAANAGKIYQVNQSGYISLTTDTLDTIIDNRVNTILNTAITNLNEVIGV